MTQEGTTKAAKAKAAANSPEPKSKEDPAVADTTTAPDVAEEEEPQRVSTCVVNDGRGMHVGNAVNGDVCSYHAMSHRRDGTPR